MYVCVDFSRSNYSRWRTFLLLWAHSLYIIIIKIIKFVTRVIRNGLHSTSHWKNWGWSRPESLKTIKECHKSAITANKTSSSAEKKSVGPPEKLFCYCSMIPSLMLKGMAMEYSHYPPLPLIDLNINCFLH